MKKTMIIMLSFILCSSAQGKGGCKAGYDFNEKTGFCFRVATPTCPTTVSAALKVDRGGNQDKCVIKFTSDKYSILSPVCGGNQKYELDVRPGKDVCVDRYKR